MFTHRQFRRQQQRQKSTAIDSWKVRSINGFEKYLFPNTQISSTSIPKYKLMNNIDPARFIYARDAMGDMLHRKSPTFKPFYLPKYDVIQTRSPIWTIKNIHHSKRVVYHVGPMTYDSVNDKSQLPCKSGWTQLGRPTSYIHSGLTVPFYDTRKYKEVGDSCSVSFRFFSRCLIYFV
jgi:hypothetical protein